jgi:uncharacterized membrane protein YkvA (DUF1232 family)
VGERGEVSSRSRAKDLLLFLPRLVKLLGRLLVDSLVSKGDKALLAVAVAYVLSPLDLVPDFIPVVGGLDDLYLLALALLRLVNRAGEDRIRVHWDGPEDIFGLLGQVTEVATAILPQRVRRLIEKAVESGTYPE